MLKYIVLPIVLFAASAEAHGGTWIRHPQADVNIYCRPHENINVCIDTACSYASSYGYCRIIDSRPDVIYIESYYPPPPPDYYYRPPVVVRSQTWPVFLFCQPSYQDRHDHRHATPHNRSRVRHRHR